MVKIFKHRKRTQILGYRSPDWFKGHVVSVKTKGLTFKRKCGKVKVNKNSDIVR